MRARTCIRNVENMDAHTSTKVRICMRTYMRARTHSCMRVCVHVLLCIRTTIHGVSIPNKSINLYNAAKMRGCRYPLIPSTHSHVRCPYLYYVKLVVCDVHACGYIEVRTLCGVHAVGVWDIQIPFYELLLCSASTRLQRHIIITPTL